MAVSLINCIRENFLNKICTIITVPVNRNFAEEAQAISKPQLYPINLMDHFMGRLIIVEPNFLIIEHPELHTKTFFRMEQVVSIVEEQVLDPKNPEHAKAISEYKEYNAKDNVQSSPTPPPADDESKKVACPSCKNRLRVPDGIEDGSLVRCPLCTEEFTISRTHPDFIDVDDLEKLASDIAKV